MIRIWGDLLDRLMPDSYSTRMRIMYVWSGMDFDIPGGSCGFCASRLAVQRACAVLVLCDECHDAVHNYGCTTEILGSRRMPFTWSVMEGPQLYGDEDEWDID